MLGARSREDLGALESGWGPPLVGGPVTRGCHLPLWVSVHLPVDGRDGPGLAELTLPPVLAAQSDGHLARGPRAPRGVACGSLGVSLPRVQPPTSTRADLGPSGSPGVLVPLLGCFHLSGAAGSCPRWGWGPGKGLCREDGGRAVLSGDLCPGSSGAAAPPGTLGPAHLVSQVH